MVGILTLKDIYEHFFHVFGTIKKGWNQTFGQNYEVIW